MSSKESGMKLPAQIESLLLRHGRAVSGVAPLSGHATTASKAAYRIIFADSSSAKARLHGTDAWAAQVEHIQDLIGPHPSLAATLVRSGRAVLEEWVPGATLHEQPPTPETLHACGRLLANLHRVPVAEQASSDATVETAFVRMFDQLVTLRTSGALGAREVQSLVAIADATAPARATSGIIHFDFCGKNLVMHADRGPVCIDNETLRFGPFDLDLARTFYRWPLSQDDHAAFLAGYVAGGGPAETTHLPFWSLAAEIYSAFIRCRDGDHEADVPLATLRERARTRGAMTAGHAPAERTKPC
jgi:aminoglycoside phosphotransferase (APT) family kinase protein